MHTLSSRVAKMTQYWTFNAQHEAQSVPLHFPAQQSTFLRFLTVPVPDKANWSTEGALCSVRHKDEHSTHSILTRTVTVHYIYRVLLQGFPDVIILGNTKRLWSRQIWKGTGWGSSELHQLFTSYPGYNWSHYWVETYLSPIQAAT